MAQGQYRTLLLDRLKKDTADGGPKLTPPAAFPLPETIPFDCSDLWPLAKDWMIRTHGRDEEGLLKIGLDDLPPCPPPYKSVWYEWRDWKCVSAVSFFVLDQLDEGGWPGAHPKMAHLTEGARWLMVGTPFSALLEEDERIICPDFAMVAAVAGDGTVLRTVFAASGHVIDPAELNKRGTLMLPGDCMIALFYQALLSCRNVDREEVEPPPKLSKKRVRHGGLPLVRYHTLRVRVPGTKRYVDMGEVRRHTENPIPVGLHLRRGHFKHYTAERPLLGRAVGTFYWAPSLVGKLEAGAVGKSYREIPAERAAEKITKEGV